MPSFWQSPPSVEKLLEKFSEFSPQIEWVFFSGSGPSRLYFLFVGILLHSVAIVEDVILDMLSVFNFEGFLVNFLANLIFRIKKVRKIILF